MKIGDILKMSRELSLEQVALGPLFLITNNSAFGR